LRSDFESSGGGEAAANGDAITAAPVPARAGAHCQRLDWPGTTESPGLVAWPSGDYGYAQDDRFARGFAGRQDAQGETAAVFEGLDGGGDFQNAIADGAQAVGFVGAGEEFGFDHAVQSAMVRNFMGSPVI